MAGLGLIGGKEGFDQEKIGDRVYRLRENKQQNRCDHFAYGGALGGAALSCLRGGQSTFRSLSLMGLSYLGILPLRISFKTAVPNLMLIL